MPDDSGFELLSRQPGPHEVGATWLLKALAGRGRLDGKTAHALLDKLGELTNAEAILHVLQIARLVDATPAHGKMFRPFLDHQRAQVRVWALQAPEASMRAHARKLALFCQPPVARSP